MSTGEITIPAEGTRRDEDPRQAAIEGLQALTELEIPTGYGLTRVYANLVRAQVAERFHDVAEAFRTSPPSRATPNFSMDSRLATGEPRSEPLVRIVNYSNPTFPNLRTTAIHVRPSQGEYQGHQIDLLLPVKQDGSLSTHSFPEAYISREVNKVINQGSVEQNVSYRVGETYRPGTDPKYNEDDSRIFGDALRECVTSTLEFLGSVYAFQTDSADN